MSSSKDEEINRRINLGWQTFGRSSWIFKDKKIPLTLKRKVYNQCILPTVTYGSETWNLTTKQTIKLRSMQRAHERIMLGVSLRDHIKSEEIRSKTGLLDIMSVISAKKWKWAGHLARLTDNRWTYKLTFWTPYGGKRNPGSQKIRWRDDLKKLRDHWHQDVQDRKFWKILEKAFVQQRTFQA